MDFLLRDVGKLVDLIRVFVFSNQSEFNSFPEQFSDWGRRDDMEGTTKQKPKQQSWTMMHQFWECDDVHY